VKPALLRIALLTPAAGANRVTLPRARAATAQGHDRVSNNHLARGFVGADSGGNDSGKPSGISVARQIMLKA
jgi:hypothetical protein